MSQLAFGLRTELGDPDFVTGLVDKQMQWTSPKGIAQRAKMITDKTHEPDYYKGPELVHVRVQTLPAPSRLKLFGNYANLGLVGHSRISIMERQTSQPPTRQDCYVQ